MHRAWHGRISALPPTLCEGVTYLIVGLDRSTQARWHEHVSARDVGSATRIARTRAAAQGFELVVAAVIGPNSAVV
jgi:hypothetical protein